MRFTPLLGYYRTQNYLLTPTEYQEGGSGGSGGVGSAEVDNIYFNHITRNNGGGIGWHYRLIGNFNPHGFVDPVKIDQGLQLRGQDLVKLEKASGTTVHGGVGFFRTINAVDPDEWVGFGWNATAGGNWRSFIRDLPHGAPPARTLREVDHSTLPASSIQLLGIVFDSQTKTVYWIANNDVVDWYTPSEGIGPLSSAPAWNYHLAVDSAEGFLRFQGGGDSHIVNIGAADSGDLVGASIEKPTVTVVATTDTEAQFTSSAFVHDPGTASHLASQWQTALATDPTFLSPVKDAGWNCQDLVGHLESGLIPLTNYLERVRYIGDDGTISPWSDGAPFTTLDGDDPGVDPNWPVCEPANPTIWTSE